MQAGSVPQYDRGMLTPLGQGTANKAQEVSTRLPRSASCRQCEHGASYTLRLMPEACMGSAHTPEGCNGPEQDYHLLCCRMVWCQVPPPGPPVCHSAASTAAGLHRTLFDLLRLAAAGTSTDPAELANMSAMPTLHLAMCVVCSVPCSYSHGLRDCWQPRNAAAVTAARAEFTAASGPGTIMGQKLPPRCLLHTGLKLHPVLHHTWPSVRYDDLTLPHSYCSMTLHVLILRAEHTRKCCA
jgi:hypothetical protein